MCKMLQDAMVVMCIYNFILNASRERIELSCTNYQPI